MEEFFHKKYSTEENNSVEYLHQLKDFFLAGLSFREALKGANEVDKKSFIKLMLHILPLLYQKGLALPSSPQAVNLSDKVDLDIILPEFVSEEEYTWIENSLENLLGNEDYFLESMGEEMKFSDAPFTARLSEYLSDIYQPVSNLLLTAKSRDYLALPFAILHCQKLFQEYWGDKVLASLRALHMIYFMREDNTDEDNIEGENNREETESIECYLQNRINAFMEDLDDDDKSNH